LSSNVTIAQAHFCFLFCRTSRLTMMNGKRSLVFRTMSLFHVCT